MAFADKLQSLQEQLQNFNFNELSVNNIGTWPLLLKVIVWVVIFVGLVFAGRYFVISEMEAQHAEELANELKLREEFTNKAYQAVNLDAYRKQMEEMEESFGALISQLPSDTEVPGLLEDITNKGEGSGLVFQAIKLEKERTREFYIELPIKITATGTYHDMGSFVSGVASLPRIVTLSDFSIRPKGKRGEDSSQLQVNMTASTYRYRDLSNA